MANEMTFHLSPPSSSGEYEIYSLVRGAGFLKSAQVFRASCGVFASRKSAIATANKNNLKLEGLST